MKDTVTVQDISVITYRWQEGSPTALLGISWKSEGWQSSHIITKGEAMVFCLVQLCTVGVLEGLEKVWYAAVSQQIQRNLSCWVICVSVRLSAAGS